MEPEHHASPPARGRGSKHPSEHLGRDAGVGRPLHGGVDRNSARYEFRSGSAGRPLHGGVDRNGLCSVDGCWPAPVAPCTGAWIETAGPRPSPYALGVAPCTGAWIETLPAGALRLRHLRRPLHGGVDRNLSPGSAPFLAGRSPPARGRGSKHAGGRRGVELLGRPLHGGVDRNNNGWTPAQWRESRPLHGGVDRNSTGSGGGTIECTSPPARGRGSKHPLHDLADETKASPPARGRGSKLHRAHDDQRAGQVAPCTGAWIETPSRSRPWPGICCRPLHGGVDRNCGGGIGVRVVGSVAPCTGAWIETPAGAPTCCSTGVAPCTGAWIETSQVYLRRCGGARRPLHGGVDRNSKRLLLIWASETVAPCTGAWIETSAGRRCRPSHGGRPLHGGVDRNAVAGELEGRVAASPPARGRGSKHRDRDRGRGDEPSPPARGRGSKHRRGHRGTGRRGRRPLHGGVDRNGSTIDWLTTSGLVAPCTGAWIETGSWSWASAPGSGRPLHGGVDRNAASRQASATAVRSPPARGRGSKRPLARRLDPPVLSPPARGRGSKPTPSAWAARPASSPPARGRGSKRTIHAAHLQEGASPPARGRGSKLLEPAATRPGLSRPLHGGVDRNLYMSTLRTNSPRRPLHGGVDRNSLSMLMPVPIGGSPPARGRGSKRQTAGRHAAAGGSPPARGRGSKHPRRPIVIGRRAVAPCTGAWIETATGFATGSGRTSPPARGRGSKRLRARRYRSGGRRPLHGGVDRNPRVRSTTTTRPPSPPARGRGSKHPHHGARAQAAESPPARGRGSKRHRPDRQERHRRRPLHGGVDRNHRPVPCHRGAFGSPPARGRGSKLQPRVQGAARRRRPLHGGVDRNTGLATRYADVNLVAPCTGAWIETRRPRSSAGAALSPPARGRGSKLLKPAATRPGLIVAPCTGAWIETASTSGTSPAPSVAPCTGAWIETSWRTPSMVRAGGRPPRGGRGSKPKHPSFTVFHEDPQLRTGAQQVVQTVCQADDLRSGVGQGLRCNADGWSLVGSISGRRMAACCQRRRRLCQMALRPSPFDVTPIPLLAPAPPHAFLLSTVRGG